MSNQLIGYVVSDKADKTVVVKIDRRITHPVYGKQYTRSSKIMAHDETNQAKMGDKVKIVETVPISKRKRWAVATVLEKFTGLEVEEVK